MFKRGLTYCAGFVLVLGLQQANAANLWQTYQQALVSDPTYKAAVSTEMSAAEAVPESFSTLLPQINFTGDAQGTQKSIYATPSKYTRHSRDYSYELKLTQKIFDFTNWQELASAKNSVKASKATFNAAAQSLMQRTASAYFAVLQSEEILRYTKANKQALYQQYMQAQQQYEVGVKTITDVYQARADYEASVSEYISAKNDLDNKFENLRVITGKLYKSLVPLKDNLPLVNPRPNNIDKWAATAVKQNWSLAAAHYTTLAAQDTIKAEQGGHLPTVGVFAQYDKTFHNYFRNGGVVYNVGPSAGLEFSVPIFAGGGVNSAVRKAIADYETASHQQEVTRRSVVNNTRQAYLGVLTGISTIRSNRKAVTSSQSSLRGTQEEYKVGTQTMVDVLIAQKKLYDSQREYVNSRYDYVNGLINLKAAAGTLSANDLLKINGWLRSGFTGNAARTKHLAARQLAVKKMLAKKLAARQKTKLTAKNSQNYNYIQVGAYDNKKEAREIANLVHGKTKSPCVISSVKRKGKVLYRVRVGPVRKEYVAQLVKKIYAHRTSRYENYST